jgi:hypothetical protein
MVKDGQLSATEAIKQLRTDPSNAVAKLIEAIDAAARVGKTRVTGKILKTRPADAADKPMGPAAPSGAAPLSVCIDNALVNRLRAAGDDTFDRIRSIIALLNSEIVPTACPHLSDADVVGVIYTFNVITDSCHFYSVT